VGLLLASIKCIKSISLTEQGEFGKGCHTKSLSLTFTRQPTNLLLENSLFLSTREGNVL
jgi:hypothetical protein